ncbi:MAG: hypothetical protein ACLPN5_19415 [Roseiarcus sp.]
MIKDITGNGVAWQGFSAQASMRLASRFGFTEIQRELSRAASR